MSFNPLTLTGKRILITGAASGIGRATAVLLSKLGAALVLWDIDQTGIDTTRELCEHTEIVSVTADLQNIAGIKPALTEVIEKTGKLNGFVHLAGRPYIAPLKSVRHETLDAVFQLNTLSGLELAKNFANKNICEGNSGSIVFISSVYGLVGSSANVGYAMSKSALHGITRSLAIELAPKKIRVNCVAPGFVKTKMLDDVSAGFDRDYYNHINQLHPLGLGEPEDVAGTIAFLLSDMSKWMSGSVLSVDGGYTAQ